jgi:hypothetical protein
MCILYPHKGAGIVSIEGDAGLADIADVWDFIII